MQKKKKYFGKITIAIIIVAIAIELAIIYELNAYKNGVLDVYGIEQDGYVQITLDQIGRLGTNADEDRITEIIASMDATSSKYWTLSTGDNILFIKSVTETDRYKIFTAGSYYDSDTARAFVDAMEVGEVNHALIDLDDGTYVASGGNFEWNGQTYRICLLTLEEAILEKNDLLEAENAILVFATLSLAILVSVTMILTRKMDKNTDAIGDMQEQLVEQNRLMERMDNMIKTFDTYNVSFHIYAEYVIGEFMDSLSEQGVKPLHLALFSFEDQKSMYDFLGRMQLKLDNRILRFHVGEDRVLLVFAGIQKKVAEDLIADLQWEGNHLVRQKDLPELVNYRGACETFLSEENDD